MSEEEKKAIEWLRKQVDFWKRNNIKDSYEEALLDRLEQLEKENERLKLENNALQNTKDTCPFMATSGIRCANKKEEYIPKSVIREKIEELSYKRDKTEIAYYLDAKIDILKELLGDEK